ncbi:hypothetical protein [Pseudomonas sp. NPDC090208]|uniref:hypothetical protein n=1 Tax=Pseudomonas sp. NPDC090208 TaxID=3364478 RepID=UPI0037FC52BF
MQYLNVKPVARTQGDRQRNRLATANLILKELAACGLVVFGDDQRQARLEIMSKGGVCFVPAWAGAAEIALDTAVRGRERLLPGFRGTRPEQHLLRGLATYVVENRPVGAAMLWQAMTSDGTTVFERIEPNFRRIIEQFRFTRAFTKVTTHNPKWGPAP